jgi:hypothetical protein
LSIEAPLLMQRRRITMYHMVSLPAFAGTRFPFFRLRSAIRRPRSVTGATADKHPIIVAEYVKLNLVGFSDRCFGRACPILHSYIASHQLIYAFTHQLIYAFTHQRINQLPDRNFNKPLWQVFIICYLLLL